MRRQRAQRAPGPEDGPAVWEEPGTTAKDSELLCEEHLRFHQPQTTRVDNILCELVFPTEVL